VKAGFMAKDKDEEGRRVKSITFRRDNGEEYEVPAQPELLKKYLAEHGTSLVADAESIQRLAQLMPDNETNRAFIETLKSIAISPTRREDEDGDIEWLDEWPEKGGVFVERDRDGKVCHIGNDPRKLRAVMTQLRGSLLVEEPGVFERMKTDLPDDDDSRRLIISMEARSKRTQSDFEVVDALLPSLRRMSATELAVRLGDKTPLVDEFALEHVEEKAARATAQHVLENKKIRQASETAREANALAREANALSEKANGLASKADHRSSFAIWLSIFSTVAAVIAAVVAVAALVAD
jgi:hypothetical protein